MHLGEAYGINGCCVCGFVKAQILKNLPVWYDYDLCSEQEIIRNLARAMADGEIEGFFCL